MLSPCPGCGALFPEIEGPTHRYVGASAGCWALFNRTVTTGESGTADLVAQSEIPGIPVRVPALGDMPLLEALIGDAYGVQHHGGESPQAIQSVAVHLLNIHGILSGRTTQPRWPIGRALRTRGVFHKLEPPAPGSALTIRHLCPGGGVAVPVTRGQYVVSVYEAWMALHRSTVEQWYERYVVPDRIYD
jgi:hypothetical protein